MIFISVDESVIARLLGIAQKGEETLPELLERISLELEEKQSKSSIGTVASTNWVEIALEKVRVLKVGEEFSLWSLLGDHWDELPARNVLGRMLKKSLEQEGLARRADEEDIEIPGVARMARYVRN